MYTIIVAKKYAPTRPETYISDHQPMFLTDTVFRIETKDGYFYHNINDVFALECLTNGQST